MVFGVGCSSSAVGTGNPSGTTAQGGTNATGDTTVSGPTTGVPTAEVEPIPDGAKRVFVTSSQYDAHFDEAPLSASDKATALCQAAATAAELGGKWTAWMGTAEAISGDGPWYTLSGKKAFNNAANLLTTPLAAIDYDEMVNAVSHYDYVWSRPCGGSDYAERVNVGKLRGGSAYSCFYEAHLYCFEN